MGIESLIGKRRAQNIRWALAFIREDDWLFDYIEELRSVRTLTLANGTVVRVGDVLVTERGYVWLITAIGERLAMGRIIERNGEPAKHDSYTHEQLLDLAGTLLPNKGEHYWRLWSEAYPDRPVPSGSKISS